MAPATHGATECQLRDQKRREVWWWWWGGIGNSVIDAWYWGAGRKGVQKRGGGKKHGRASESFLHGTGNKRVDWLKGQDAGREREREGEQGGGGGVLQKC